LANIKSAEKRAAQDVARRAHNNTLRSKMRTAIKKARAAIATGQKDTAEAALKAATPVIDSMVNKGIVHRNTAARHKSRLSALVKGLGA
jgi:small subunit ribosomal protein S20